MTAARDTSQCETCRFFRPMDPQHVGWCNVGKVLRHTTADDGCKQHEEDEQAEDSTL